jgi:photosystem II stability/assembly factor-like uncharacterized protein
LSFALTAIAIGCSTGGRVTSPTTSVALAPATTGTEARGRGETTPVVRSLWFVDRVRGFAGTTTGIFVTGDGGHGWAKRLNGPSIKKITFVDAEHGWAVGEETLLATADGGESWRPAGEPPDPLALPGFTGDHGIGDYAGPFTVIDARVALLIGQCLACAPTTQSLVVANVDGPWAGGRIPALDGTEADFAISPTFVDRDHGWVVTTRMEDQRSLIAATSDGGRTWDLLPTPGP